MIHFFIFLIAVNFVFFPMHFLGLNGKPRRIPNYPDGYIYWNEIISYGSLLTIISIIIFIYIIANKLFINKVYYIRSNHINFQ